MDGRMMRAGDAPRGHWFSFGLQDTRVYVLHIDNRGIDWPWFHDPEGGWKHTLDPIHEDKPIAVRGPVDADLMDGLAEHVKAISAQGCGAVGWCSAHSSATS